MAAVLGAPLSVGWGVGLALAALTALVVAAVALAHIDLPERASFKEVNVTERLRVGDASNPLHWMRHGTALLPAAPSAGAAATLHVALEAPATPTVLLTVEAPAGSTAAPALMTAATPHGFDVAVVQAAPSTEWRLHWWALV